MNKAKQRVFETEWREHLPEIEKAFEAWFGEDTGNVLELPEHKQEKLIKDMHIASYSLVSALYFHFKAIDEGHEEDD